MKMLKMMGGFEVGKGVGKSNQGIVNPVEAVYKKDNVCLGTGLFEEKKGGNDLVKETSAKAIPTPEEQEKIQEHV